VGNSAELLVPLNARYIIVLRDYTDTDDYLWLFKRKGGVPGIELAYEGRTLYLFKNPLAGGPFMATDDAGDGNFADFMETLGGNISSAGTEYEQVTPAMYRVSESPGPYLVFARPHCGDLEYNGQGASSWYGLACVFQYTGPGTVTNRVFPVILALFLLAWAIALALIMNPPKWGVAALAAFIIPMYCLIWEGVLGPHAIGVALAVSLGLSVLVSLGVFSGKITKSFLKLK
jgi:hypothetical protein